jgi:1,2-phenylacetyl-CoA epoxidase catalytic subunit
VPDWARTIARRCLYEQADEQRLAALKASDDPEVAGLAAKIDREEVYHRLHAEMWVDRLLQSSAGRERSARAVTEMWPYALGVLEPELRAEFQARIAVKLPFPLRDAPPVARDSHSDELEGLWREMTEVRLSVPGAAW